MNNESGSNQIVVRSSSSPFRDSFMSTVGGGFGIFALAGIPALCIGGVILYVGWRIYNSVIKSKNIKIVESSSKDVTDNVSGLNKDIDVKFLDQPRRVRSSKSKRSSARIVT